MKIKTTAINKVPRCNTITIDNDTRVFIVGDLDGNYTKLETELTKVNFKPEEDVLISLGDIIDRGENSTQLVNYFQDIGAHVVLGNHEHMMLESLLSRDMFALRLWSQNGGKWHQSESVPALLTICKWLLKQPLAIKLEYQGHTIGISHTLPSSWDWNNFPTDINDLSWQLLWDRERFTKRQHISNTGVDFSVHGHNSTQQCRWIGNSLHIDTSYYGKPTVINVADTIQTYQQLKTQ